MTYSKTAVDARRNSHDDQRLMMNTGGFMISWQGPEEDEGEVFSRAVHRTAPDFRAVHGACDGACASPSPTSKLEAVRAPTLHTRFLQPPDERLDGPAEPALQPACAH